MVLVVRGGGGGGGVLPWCERRKCGLGGNKKGMCPANVTVCMGV